MDVTYERAVSYEALRTLAARTNGVTVSIFHPTVKASFEKQQNKDRLKTLIAGAEPLLGARGLEKKEIDPFLAPARGLIDDGAFWARRLDGLAVYLDKDHLRVFRLPFEVRELVEVSNGPCVRPLLPALATAGHFHVLALSRNRVRLFRGTRAGMEEIDIDQLGIPKDLAGSLEYDDFERQMQSHATSRAGRIPVYSQAGTREGRHVWHGHGGGETTIKEQTQRFFAQVDRGLGPLLNGVKGPLILAATSSEGVAYRSISTNPHIAAAGIEGSPDRKTPQELHAAAWPIAERILGERVRAARNDFLNASTVGQATDALGEALRAAHEGRVATAVVQSDADVWGHYDVAGGAVEQHRNREMADDDLLDLAVKQILIHGGEVYPLGREEMPTEQPLAVVYRY